MKLILIEVIMVVIALICNESVAGKYIDCDCSYSAGGCWITSKPPKGFKCECWYKGFWTCGGAPKKCRNKYEEGCHGCWDKICCLGDCDAY